jgi:deoxyribose-phosphate aldolase
MIELIQDQSSAGNVADFPRQSSLEEKAAEAALVIENADELDFVCDYESFKAGNTELKNGELRKMVCENGKMDLLKLAALKQIDKKL